MMVDPTGSPELRLTLGTIADTITVEVVSPSGLLHHIQNGLAAVVSLRKAPAFLNTNESQLMILRTLYKRTSTGAIQQWATEIDRDRYRSISGQVGGKLVEAGWSFGKPKNVGKSNETSAVQQAELEVQAAYVKKLAQGGYHETIEEIDQAKFFKPMLAKNYDDYPVEDFTNVFSQPKLDGIRCIANKDGLWTRQGKSIEAVPHIHRALKPIFDKLPWVVFDGELYADKLSQDFNKIVSLVKKVNPTPERLAEAAGIVEYHIYDFPGYEGFFAERMAAISEVMTVDDPMIKIVATAKVEDQEMLDHLNGRYLEQGYEGQIVRHSNSVYEQKRTKQLLKRKVFDDAEFRIVSINEGEGNRIGMAGFITYELGDGRTFGSGIRGSHDWCKVLLQEADEYEGGVGTVRYFSLTPDGVPRFPVTTMVFKGERDV